MSPLAPEVTPAALARRAAAEFTSGGYLAAQTAALCAIAGALAGLLELAVAKGPHDD